jgi:peptidoglycan/LPS O-acetylase OafA/YrhL
MAQISMLFFFPVIFLALIWATLMSRLLDIKVQSHRYGAIDGLRGYLAMFVFLHHGGSWFWMYHIHQWAIEPNTVFLNIGFTGVGMFFMITSFLFSSKLIDSYNKPLDWTKLYTSRILRIMPLYLFAMAGLVFFTCMLTQFKLHESLGAWFKHVGQWLVFMQPDINRIQGTKFLIAGVQWTLAYEWIIYCSLALMGWLFFKIPTRAKVWIIATLFLCLFIYIIYVQYPDRNWRRMTPFLSGIASAFLVRIPRIKNLFSRQWMAVPLLASLVLVIMNYPSLADPIALLGVSFTFLGIASGNDLFGILTAKPSLYLGQISYSIYLLHALVLSCTFVFLLPGYLDLSPLTHWLIICGSCVAMITICTLSYTFIEKPGMDSAGRVLAWFRKPRRSPDIFAKRGEAVYSRSKA